jgi:hypothetical protein
LGCFAPLKVSIKAKFQNNLYKQKTAAKKTDLLGEKYCLPTLYSIFKNNLPFHKPFNQNNLYHGYASIDKKVRINKRSLCKCSVRLESLTTF